jgi:hypothetical protein
MTWVAIETYYKHGEYLLHVFYSESSLRDYLYEKLDQYNMKSEIDDACDILYLISVIEERGNYRVDEQLGWGVREIRQI